MSATLLKDPRRYFEAVEARDVTASPPVCLYLEVTNRCNLLCETCPRTFETLEPPQDMTWELFTSIVDQFPSIARVVLHGVGEPMLVKELPQMIRYLKDRGIYVLFNTNGTLLNPKKFQELIDTGLDELRVSVDAADRKTYLAVRGKDFFNRIVRDVGKFTAFQAQVGSATPKVSIWLTGLKETVQQLPEFVRMAANMGVKEVHLQRLVFDDAGFGMARAENSLFEQTQAEEEQAIAAATAIGAAGRRDAGCVRRHRTRRQPEEPGWRHAVGDLPPPLVADVFHRPWPRPALLHRAVLGTRLQQLHAGRRHAAEPAGDLEWRPVQGLPPQPAQRHAAKALRELRPEVVAVAGDGLPTPGVTVVIPTLNEADAIAAVVREVPRSVVGEIIVADSGSKDGTQRIAAEAGARVLDLHQRGYGLACARAAEAADPASDIIVFMDGDGADRADLMHLLVDPIRAGTQDFVIASRTRGERDPGSMNWHQVLAGQAAGLGMRALYGVRYTDMCAFRAIRRSSLLALGLREMTYGWNIEMQMQAARAGLRILEVPVPYRCRAGGQSKVAGSVRGTLRAGWRIVTTFVRVAGSPTPAKVTAAGPAPAP